MSSRFGNDIRAVTLRIMRENRFMTIATNRPDGWPQATTVGYVNRGLLLYCFVARTSQKFINVAKDRRVSVCITGEFATAGEISGISLAGLVDVIQDKEEYLKSWRLFANRSPEFSSWPEPNPGMAALLQITPLVISVIDYSKAFGHSNLVKISNSDLRAYQLN